VRYLHNRRNRATTLDAFFRTLLRHLMTGRVRVKDGLSFSEPAAPG
jgi:hypothetical protein